MSDVAWLWLVRVSVGGGGLLLLVWWTVRRTSSPVYRQRLGEWGLAGSLLLPIAALGPGWLAVPWPQQPEVTETLILPTAELEPGADWDEAHDELPEMWDTLDQEVRDPVANLALVDCTEPRPMDWGFVIALLYVGVSVLLVARLLLGRLALAWWLRSREPVPGWLNDLWRELTSQGWPVRLIVSPRIQSPFCFGLWRPVVVLPAALVREGATPALRWILHHELAHLRRGDPWLALLPALAQGLYFFCPWFWWLWREIRLCQEYLADETAIANGADRVDYAQMLVNRVLGRGLPAGVPGFSLGSSNLYRRVTMILQPMPRELTCSRRWLMVIGGAILTVALVLAGLSPARAEDDQKDPEKKDPDKVAKKDPDRKDPETKKEPAKKGKKGDKPEVKVPFPDIDDLLKKLPADLDKSSLDQIRRHLENAKRSIKQTLEMAERMKEMRRQSARFMLRSMGAQVGRLGARLTTPSAALVEQLDLPKDRGLLIESVVEGTAADKAGLKANDILLEVNGKAVPTKRGGLEKILEGIAANKAVDVVVLRKGKKTTIKGLTLPEPQASPRTRTIRRTGVGRQIGNRVTLTDTDGGTTVIVRGKKVGNTVQVEEIRISDTDGTKTYSSADKVPAEYQGRVTRLLKGTERKEK